ncbi:MAG: GNAT family N-acetyltransferase [Lachnospiraceae bacterium]|nr:GNAT family N-acetyltransferase [Lachnospiraceae bacterium]
MNTIIHTVLTPAQRAAIQSLVAACSAHDHTNLSFPFDDGELFVFSDKGNGLADGILSAAAFSLCGADSWDCSAFTHPSLRNQGAFSALLEAGLSKLSREGSIFFYADPSCQDTMAALSALHTEHLADEHMMELAPGDFFKAADRIGSTECTVSEIPDSAVNTLHITVPDGEVFINCHTAHYYLYGLQIAPDRRGQGLGKLLLTQTLSRLFLQNPKPVRLQVSGDNTSALSLYKKTGFRITETLSCYLFSYNR